MNNPLQDILQGIRSLWKVPKFTAVVVATLALGIGANTAIFSVVSAVLLHPLPYKDPERLVHINWQWDKGETRGVTTTQYVFWTENSRSFEKTAASSGGTRSFNLTGSGEPIRVNGWSVSANLLPLLGVDPMMGRNFTAEEDTRSGPRAVIITYGLWQRYFGRDPNILQGTVLLDELDYSVVGVLSKSFHFDGDGDLIVPLRLESDPRDQGHNTDMLARLAPGVSLEHAQAEMGRLLPRFREMYPSHIEPTERGVRLVPYATHRVGETKNTLLMLFGAVAFVLLIACANVANLVFARATGRAAELAIRAAMGASRWRLVRQLMLENAALAFAGGALGYVLALWVLPVLLAATPKGLPRVDEVQFDSDTATFAFGLSLFTTVLFGLAPAWRASKLDLTEALKAISGNKSSGRAALRMGKGLIVTEVALALILLVGAGLFLRSFVSLNSVTLGFDPNNLTVMQLSLSSQRYRTTAASLAFQQELMERIRTVPGVVSVAAVPGLPFERAFNFYITIPRAVEPIGGSVEMRTISPEYFETLGITTLRGRGMSEADAIPGARELFVNESLARAFWQGTDPVGQAVSLGGRGRGQPWTVAGVVSDIREKGLARDPRPTLYVHAAQLEDGMTRALNAGFLTSFLIRTSRPTDLSAALRAVVLELDSQLPIVGIRRMQDVIGTSIAKERFLLLLMSVFAGLALTLTCIGIFSVVSYHVTQRTREIGIRMALGACRGDVVRMIMRQGLVLVGGGLVIGIAGAAAASGLLKNLLFGVKPVDAATYVGVGLFLLVVAASACWLPARRATRVDPMVVLRYE